MCLFSPSLHPTPAKPPTLPLDFVQGGVGRGQWGEGITGTTIKILFIFKERGKGGEREGEKHECAVVSHMSPTGNLARNPGMCLDWDLNQQPIVSQASTPLSHTSQGNPRFILTTEIIRNISSSKKRGVCKRVSFSSMTLNFLSSF